MDTFRLILLMIVGTAIGGILCFLNGLFKKPYLYLRNIVFFILIGFFVAMQIGIAIRRSSYYYRWLITLLELTVPFIFAAISVFLGMLDDKNHEMISMIITGPTLFCLLRLNTSASLFSSLLIGSGVTIILFGISLLFTKQYFCFECSLTGAYVIAALYTDCFYLENAMFYIILAVLTVAGTVFGIFVKNKQQWKIFQNFQSANLQQ